MSLLFTQDWDVIRGKEDEYADFVAKQFIPRCNELGLEAVGGFYVQVGLGPQIISIKSVESLEELYKVMSNPNFKELKLDLKEYVVNYSSKILEPTGINKESTYSIQKGVWKYNQYYDVLPGKRREYDDYVANEYIPVLGEIEYVDLTEVWNVLLGGFSENIVELTFQHPVDIGRILDNEKFRNAYYKLRTNYVTNYKSRILRTTERFEEPRWFRL